jgi:hypothetical protein
LVFQHPSAPYLVEYDATVWRQIGRLDSEDFHQVQRALNVAAQTAPLTRAGRTAPASEDLRRHHATVGDLVVAYEYDDERRVVRLVGVSGGPVGARPAQGEGTGS